MADYAMLKDNNGDVCGFWFHNPEIAQDPDMINLLLAKHDLPDELLFVVSTGNYRIVPNRFDNSGGCFMMFGSELAPGERPASTHIEEMENQTTETPQRKWEQFWKS
jgi:hypothetical protein